MPRAVVLALRFLVHAALAAALVWVVLKGSVSVPEEYPLPVEEETLSGLVPTQQGDVVERRTLLGIERREELDALLVVPDPRASLHTLVPGGPLRVLDPEAIRLRSTRMPRAGRPWLVDLELADAFPADELWLERLGEAPSRVELSSGAERVAGQLRFDPLAPGRLDFSLRWTGQRDGRSGDLRLSYRVAVAPPPQVRLGPGVASGGAFARALRTQGFEIAAEGAPADLMLALLGRPPEPELVDAVDAGLGLLLLASEGQPVDLGYLPLLPVVPLPIEEPEEIAAAGSEGGSSSSPDPAEKPEEAPAAAGEGDPDAMGEGLRRSGGASEAERERAAGDRAEREVRAAAVVFVIDASGSMRHGRPSRIQMAKQALLASALQLGEQDEFAIVRFSQFAKVAVRMGRADRKELLREKLRELTADAGATNGYPALRAAHEELKQVLGRNPVRHVVMVTDGELQDQLSAPYRKLLAQMRREGISISAIGIWTDGLMGNDPFRFLERDIVKPTGGRFAEARDPRDLPRLLLGEVQLVRGAQKLEEGDAQAKKEGEEEPEQPEPKDAEQASKEDTPDEGAPGEEPESPRLELFVVQSEPLLRGLEEHEWPPLAGALPLEAQLQARVHLALGDEGRVALAAAPFGLGRVAVFAGSDGGAWTGDFVMDEQFPQLVGQLGSWLQREAAATPSVLVPRELDWLSGAGREPGLLELAAARLGAQPASSFPAETALADRAEERAPLGRILLFGAAFLLLLGLERLLRARL